MSRNNRLFPAGTVFLFGLFLLVMLVTYMLLKPPAPPPELEGVLRSEFRQLFPFNLTDQSNVPFGEQRLAGKWTFVFFGYTSCPDVCPTTLYEMASLENQLNDESEENSDDIQVVFISIDPERDTVEVLAKYVPYFSNSFIGATANKEEIDKLIQQFGVGYVLEPESAPGHYTVTHTSAIFLVDPLSRLVASFSQPHSAKTIASQFKTIRAYMTGA